MTKISLSQHKMAELPTPSIGPLLYFLSPPWRYGVCNFVRHPTAVAKGEVLPGRLHTHTNRWKSRTLRGIAGIHFIYFPKHHKQGSEGCRWVILLLGFYPSSSAHLYDRTILRMSLSGSSALMKKWRRAVYLNLRRACSIIQKHSGQPWQ